MKNKTLLSASLALMMAMNAETGKLRTVVEERANTFVNYVRLWRQFIKDGKQLLWMSERDNWNHLYLYAEEARMGSS